ncbi:MAG TPA: ComEC/Rec2 family competence protein [Clostridiales bacterium]|nr:ComEC/Rec2 family competence protein [Clostridiales bacterium]
MKRPLVLFAIALAIGILFAKITQSYKFIVISALILLMVIIIIEVKVVKNRMIILPLTGILLFYSIGGFEFLYNDRIISEKYQEYAGEQVTIKGVIDSEPEFQGKKITCVVYCKEIINNDKNKTNRNNADKFITGKISLTILTSNLQTAPAASAVQTAPATPVASVAQTTEAMLIDYGKTIEITGTLNIPAGKRNPGGFNYQSYLAGSGISATMYVKENSIRVGEESHANIFLKIGHLIRKRFINVINNSMPPKQAGLMNGMLTGYRGGISEDTKAVFSDSGLMHIIAVSGMHVGFIMLPFIFLFKKMGVKKIVSNPLIILILILYVSITGLQPSVLRAVIMASTVLLSQIIWKEPDTLASISFAAILLLIWNPHILFNIGFQMSFIATLSIVLLRKNVSEIIKPAAKSAVKYITRSTKALSAHFVAHSDNHSDNHSVTRSIADSMPVYSQYSTNKSKPASKIKDRTEKLAKKVTDILGTTLSAQAGILPLSILYFNKVSIISVVSNLMVAPVTGTVIVLGLFMAIIGQISLFAAKIAGYANNILLSFIIFISEFTAQIPFAILKTGISSIMLILVYYILVWFFLWLKPRHKIKVKPMSYAWAAICVILVISTINLIPGQLEVVFLDVGAGDSIFIRTHGGRTVLIDGGGEKGKLDNEPDTGEKIVVPFLLGYGVKKLDLVVASHGHGDHIQGLMPVLKEFNVGKVILPDYIEGNEFDKILTICGERKINVTYCSQGDTIKLDKKTYFEVLNPPRNIVPEIKMSLNNSSLVLKLYYKNVTMLFTGDIEKEIEEILADNLLESGVHVFKVPHHGSETSSIGKFLELVKPQVAVISTGRNNYGHPAPSVLKRLEETGTGIYRTDLNGAVIIRTNGRLIKVKTMLNGEQG